MVEEDDRRLGSDLSNIDEPFGVVAHLAADHPDPAAVLTAGVAGDGVVGPPDLDPPAVVPLDPRGVRGTGPVMLGRQLEAYAVTEAAGAVVAVADLAAFQSRPAVVGEPVRA